MQAGLGHSTVQMAMAPYCHVCAAGHPAQLCQCSQAKTSACQAPLPYCLQHLSLLPTHSSLSLSCTQCGMRGSASSVCATWTGCWKPGAMFCPPRTCIYRQPDSLQSHCNVAQVYLRHMMHGASEHLCLVCEPSRSSNYVCTKLSACHRLCYRSIVGSMEGHCSYGLQVVKAEEVSQGQPVSYAACAEQSSQQPPGQCLQHHMYPCEQCGPAQVTKRRMPKWGRAMQSRNLG